MPIVAVPARRLSASAAASFAIFAAARGLRGELRGLCRPVRRGLPRSRNRPLKSAPMTARRT
eukprot:967964-Heterocapsa_arctica.AAC.1